MPDDIDSQPPGGDLEASGPSQTPSDTPPAEKPENTDQEAASTQESVEAVDEPVQPASEAPAEEVDTAAEGSAADETLNWAAAETADKVLAEAQAAEGGELDPESDAAEDDPSEDLLLSQGELNELLGQSDDFAAETAQAAAADGTAAPDPQLSAAAESRVAPEAASPPLAPTNESEPPTQPVELPDFSPGDAASTAQNQIDLLHDVELSVKIELGRTEMYIEDVLRLGVGSVVELDKLAGDPVDIWVNRRLVARGEVLVLNDNFCVRVNEILSPIAEAEPD